METVYKFSDWTSASRMHHPVYQLEVTKQESGYVIKVVNKESRCYEYIFKVEDFSQGSWSLDTRTAVEVLNKLGFNCSFEFSLYLNDEKVVNWLKELQNLGYKWVVRNEDNTFCVSSHHLDVFYDLLCVVPSMTIGDLNQLLFIKPNGCPVLISSLLGGNLET